MPAINIWGTTEPDIAPEPTTSVYVKRDWADDWTWLPWVTCTACSDGKGGIPQSATFDWKFGRKRPPGAIDWAVYEFLNISGCYIAVWVHDDYGSAPLWIGFVEDENVNPWASLTVPTGEQQFKAVSLDEILNRRVVIGAYADCNGVLGQIQRQLTFNEQRPHDRGLQGNMSADLTVYDVYSFYTPGQGDDAAQVWSNADIIDYLLAFFANGEAEGGYDGPSFYLTGFTSPLENLYGTYEPGRHVGEMINRLIDRRRGLGYRLITDGVGDVYIDVFSYFMADNPEWDEVDGYSRRATPNITFSEAHSYDYVHVIGGPVSMCATFAVDDANYGDLVTGWSVADETAYLAINTGSAEGDDHARQSAEHDAVYQLFVVPKDWDGYCGSFNCWPVVTVDCDLSYASQSPQMTGRRQFKRTVPFYEGTDDGVAPTFRTAMVFVQVTDDFAFARYYYVDRLNLLNRNAAQVYPFDGELGFTVRPPINHIAALNYFDPDTQDSNYDPQWDLASMYVTAMWDLDTTLWCAYEVDRNTWPNEVPRVKVIEDPNAVAILIAPYTIYDVDESGFVKTGASVTEFRNDADRLRDKGLLATAWYSQAKATVNLRLKGIHLVHQPGAIITGVVDAAGFTEVGTVVSQRFWDFRQNVTQIVTGFEEFDAGPELMAL